MYIAAYIIANDFAGISKYVDDLFKQIVTVTTYPQVLPCYCSHIHIIIGKTKNAHEYNCMAATMCTLFTFHNKVESNIRIHLALNKQQNYYQNESLSNK